MNPRAFIVLVVGVALASLPRLALAGTVWTTPTFDASRAECATGNEAAAPGANLTPASGVFLGRGPRQSFTVSVHSAGGRPTAGELHAFLYDFAAGRWSRAPMFDLAVPAGSESLCKVVALAPVPSRIAFLPSGLGSAVSVFLTVG